MNAAWEVAGSASGYAGGNSAAVLFFAWPPGRRLRGRRLFRGSFGCGCSFWLRLDCSAALLFLMMLPLCSSCRTSDSKGRRTSLNRRGLQQQLPKTSSGSTWLSWFTTWLAVVPAAMPGGSVRSRGPGGSTISSPRSRNSPNTRSCPGMLTALYPADDNPWLPTELHREFGVRVSRPRPRHRLQAPTTELGQLATTK